MTCWQRLENNSADSFHSPPLIFAALTPLWTIRRNFLLFWQISKRGKVRFQNISGLDCHRLEPVNYLAINFSRSCARSLRTWTIFKRSVACIINFTTSYLCRRKGLCRCLWRGFKDTYIALYEGVNTTA